MDECVFCICVYTGDVSVVCMTACQNVTVHLSNYLFLIPFIPHCVCLPVCMHMNIYFCILCVCVCVCMKCVWFILCVFKGVLFCLCACVRV